MLSNQIISARAKCANCQKHRTMIKCSRCDISYCCQKCRVDDWHQIHKYLCAKTFHLRVVKLLNLVDSGQYKCDNICKKRLEFYYVDANPYDALSMTKYTIESQITMTGDFSRGSCVCLLCGNDIIGYRSLKAGPRYIWRCGDCYANNIGLCEKTNLPTSVCMCCHPSRMSDPCEKTTLISRRSTY